MALSNASRRSGRAAAKVEARTEQPEASSPPASQKKRVLPTRGGSGGAAPATAEASKDGATHVLLTRAVIEGQSYAPGDRVRLSPEEAAHLSKQGAVKVI